MSKGVGLRKRILILFLGLVAVAGLLLIYYLLPARVFPTEGLWVLESFSVDGELVEVVPGLNTGSQQWIQFDDRITGNTGCNDFLGPLGSTSFFATLGACDPHAMVAEMAMSGFFSRRPIRTLSADESMEYVASGEVLVFRRTDEAPDR